MFTRSIKVGDVPEVSVGGVLYRQFLLDINQEGLFPLLSFDRFRLYVGATHDATGYDPATKQLAGLDAAYDLDAGGDNWVPLNARLNSGSGSGDMTVLIPATLLGSDPNQYIYLYSAFGENQTANSGFEELGPSDHADAGGAAAGRPRTVVGVRIPRRQSERQFLTRVIRGSLARTVRLAASTTWARTWSWSRPHGRQWVLRV